MSGSEAGLGAARLGDEIVHGFGLLGMVAGAVVGAVVAAAIVTAGVATGGLALVAIVGGCIAGGGLSGGALAHGIMKAADISGPTTGALASGSINVLINGRPGMRAMADFAGGCNGLPMNHFPKPMVLIAQGSATVNINNLPMARGSMKMECGAQIKSGSSNVLAGGPTATVVPIHDNEELFATGLQVLGMVALGAAGVGAMFAGFGATMIFGGVLIGSAVGMDALHSWGESLGPGYGDIMVGVAGFALLGLGARGSKALGERSPIAQRRIDNAEMRNSPRFKQDMAKVGITEEQIQAMNAKERPLGFRDTEQFGSFKQDLHSALNKDGLADAEIGMKGTATTFYSENPGKPLGHHWDADPINKGDYDLNITSKTMVDKMNGAGISPSEKYNVFKTRDIEGNFPGLQEFSSKWSQILDRDVNFVGYPKPTPRDPTEFIFKGGK